MSNTLTRSDLAQAVHLEVGLSRNESSQLVEDVLEKITDCFVRGENVKLSSFGTFSVRSKRERIGRNPKTGQEVPITARSVVTFRASNVLKSKVNSKNKMNSEAAI